MLELESPCKVNWLLNILGKRPDGFHELETLMLPVPLCDTLRIERTQAPLELSCSDPRLPVDSRNLVWKAASAFFKASGLDGGARVHLEKRIPMEAGLGGGSGNAATTLVGLNRLCGEPISGSQLQVLAASLGSDVPFFLDPKPAVAFGRGENVRALAPSSALAGCSMLLIHPGFGISTPWAYQRLAQFPGSAQGLTGRAEAAALAFADGGVAGVVSHLFNTLEIPALHTYPILKVYQDFLREKGALGALMSGSGSTTFAVFESVADGEAAETAFNLRFTRCWTRVIAF